MDWTATNSALAALDYADEDGLREAVALLYRAMAAVPERLLQDFASFGESDLAEGAAARAADVAKGRVEVASSGTARDALLDAARLLRAIESNLTELSRFTESDLGEDLEDAWRTGDGGSYVIPRMTPLARIEGQPFLRRALLHYRVVPTEVDGFRVRLHRAAVTANAEWAARERANAQRQYGAAFFPGLIADLDLTDPGRFTVVGSSGCDLSACVAEHLEEVRRGDCRGVVWGELTMPELEVDRLQAILGETALAGCGALRYVIAGSWHTEVDGHMRNRCRVLDGYGAPLCEVFKWAKFKFGDRTEAIDPGNEVHILVGEGELVVIAICRDFLQATTDVPYLKLDVDVALVPSMIATIEERATLSTHAATANTMRVRYGTRTLVVAQPARADAKGVGQVLAFPSRPLESGGDIVDGAWHLCPLATG